MLLFATLREFLGSSLQTSEENILHSSLIPNFQIGRRKKKEALWKRLSIAEHLLSQPLTLLLVTGKGAELRREGNIALVQFLALS